MRFVRMIPVLLFVLGTTAGMNAQQTYPTKFSPAIAQRQDVKQALEWIDSNFDDQVKEWIRLTEIPAPSTRETQRGAYIRAELEKLGYKPTTDQDGNIFFRRPGTGGGPTMVLAVHMDTVFPEQTNLKVTRKPDGTLHAPGIGDNTAAVADTLSVLRAIDNAKLQTKGDVIFLFTVQEEIGLKGMYAWFERNRKVGDLLVAVDGGLGPVRYGALGIYWSKMKFTAAGAHTNRSRGVPNPVRAAAQCITDIYTVPLPDVDYSAGGAVYNVGGMITAGDVVNAVPREVTFTVDLRTVDKQVMGSLDDAIVSKCDQAARDHKVTFVREWIQRSEPGGRPDQLVDRRKHPIVQTAVDVQKYLGVKFVAGQETLATGSTDANVGVVAGIPSISIGGANGADAHTLTEWANIESARIGTKQIILLTVALTDSN